MTTTYDLPDDAPGTALDEAWGVIANAYEGDWLLASPEWRQAAERWRDTWLHAHRPAAVPVTPLADAIEFARAAIDVATTRLTAFRAQRDALNNEIRVLVENVDRLHRMLNAATSTRTRTAPDA